MEGGSHHTRCQLEFQGDVDCLCSEEFHKASSIYFPCKVVLGGLGRGRKKRRGRFFIFAPFIVSRQQLCRGGVDYAGKNYFDY